MLKGLKRTPYHVKMTHGCVKSVLRDSKPAKNYFYFKQDACTGVHSAYRREENGHNLDVCVVRRLRLTERQMQEFLGLKWGGGGLHLQIWDLNRANETERTVFPIPQVFSMCRRRL